MGKRIEVTQKPLEKENPQYIVPKYKNRMKTVFNRAKPKEGSRLHKRHLQRGTKRFKRSKDIAQSKQGLSKEENIDNYLKALSKRPDILPNIYCSRAWLLAHDVIPAKDSLGYRSFVHGWDRTALFLPGYKYIDDNNVLFKVREAQANFPLSLGAAEGIRFDVQYMFIRDVSVYMIPKALKVRNTMKNIPYTTYAIPYTDHSKDDLLRTFLTTYKERTKHNHRSMTEDVDGFEKMLFEPFGQHRYVIQRTDNNRLLAVLIWEDTGEIINMLYTVGFAERPEEYNYSRDDWKRFRYEKCLRYPEVILRYEFMKRFPTGTLFNGGGCGSSRSIKFMQEISQPAHIFEIRTMRDVVCPAWKAYNTPILKKGMLPGEFFLPVHHKKFWIDCANKVLFNGVKRKPISEIHDPHIRNMVRRRIRRRAWKFLTLKAKAESFLKKDKNDT